MLWVLGGRVWDHQLGIQAAGNLYVSQIWRPSLLVNMEMWGSPVSGIEWLMWPQPGHRAHQGRMMVRINMLLLVGEMRDYWPSAIMGIVVERTYG